MSTIIAETGFRSSSSPPMEDYRAAMVTAPDSTTAGRNSDPVAISYRLLPGPPPDPAAANTSTGINLGYINNGGPSINHRPRQPEPEKSAGLEIDFDSKVTEEYAKLDDMRATYDLARGESPTSPERLQNAMNPIYRGVPNYSKKEQKNARRSCVLQVLIAVLVVSNLFTLGLCVFNLVNTFGSGAITGTPAEEGGLTDTVTRLRAELEELQRNVSANSARQDTNLAQIVQQLQASCPPLSATTSPPPTTTTPDIATPSTTRLPDGATTPLSSGATTLLPIDVTSPPASTTPPPTSRYVSVRLYENCTIIRMGSCTISESGSLGTSPAFASCSTTPISLDDSSDGHISDVFCSASSEQLMPASSILLYTGTRVSCLCNALVIPNAVQTQLITFDCELYVKRCPLEIQVPLN